MSRRTIYTGVREMEAEDTGGVWHLKPMQLAAALVRRGFEVGRNTAARVLEEAGYRRRALRKETISRPGKTQPDPCG